jgi:hypothetical protein
LGWRSRRQLFTRLRVPNEFLENTLWIDAREIRSIVGAAGAVPSHAWIAAQPEGRFVDARLDVVSKISLCSVEARAPAPN